MRTRQHNVTAARWTLNGGALGVNDLTEPGADEFGTHVFTIAEQRARMPKHVFEKLMATLEAGEPMDASLADDVAQAMRSWAMEKGATHYTHWFQPLTGLTAEKHDSFYSPTPEGKAIAEFSGKALIQGEPDASSFPTGGLRATFEARGYTAWDPTSPAFIMENPNGAVLCIPTAFVSWTGEALDHKIPLLRSMDALSRAATKALKLFGKDVKRVYATIGPEQEYFLVEEQYYFERPDLFTCGRTLFGAKPPKGHELDEHYFGSIPERVLAFMLEAERELRKIGVPVKTRHNEVAPGQYEIAPIFENANVASDHQQLTMQILQNVARRYGLVCLLHEKPFAGVNGSGKHTNWSMGTDAGENLFDPGDTPDENTQFMFFCSAVIQAVHRHQALLRASASGPGQDHRLGANEAPPAIISIFLGDELQSAFQRVATGRGDRVERGLLGLGTELLPKLPRHGGDRNRTSPFAFTGNKFEFRAPGASQSPGFIGTVLNTIVAESIEELTEQLETELDAANGDLGIAVSRIVKEVWETSGKVVFDGDGYSEAWHREAERRGLLNLPTTPDALPALISDSTVAAFEAFNVLSERELHSRYEVAAEQYATKINIEAETAAHIARTMILPAAVRHLNILRESGVSGLAEEVEPIVQELHTAILRLERVNLKENQPDDDPLTWSFYMRDEVIPAMEAVRAVADRLEGIVADDLWPLPKYSEMLFIK